MNRQARYKPEAAPEKNAALRMQRVDRRSSRGFAWLDDRFGGSCPLDLATWRAAAAIGYPRPALRPTGARTTCP